MSVASCDSHNSLRLTSLSAITPCRLEPSIYELAWAVASYREQKSLDNVDAQTARRSWRRVSMKRGGEEEDEVADLLSFASLVNDR